MRALSLCSGCGGLDLGLEPLGIEFVAFAENDRACSAVLARHWPDTPNLGDLRHVDWSRWDADLVVSGFPCQPTSAAGRRRGEADARWLWPEVERCLRLLRPRLVLLENVTGLVASGLIGVVVGELALLGYRWRYDCLRAADLGAPHERRRVFIAACLADADGDLPRRNGRALPGAEGPRAGRLPELEPRDRASADAGRERRDGRRTGDSEREAEPQQLEHGRAEPARPAAAATEWGEYEAAIRRWETLLGRAAPRPVDDRGRLAPELPEWMLGFPEGWTRGVSRSARLRMLGNAVQVQCATAAGEWLFDFAKEEPHA